MRQAADKLVIGYDAYAMVVRQKDNFETELDRAIEMNQNEQSQFIMQVESILHYDRMVDFA